MFISFLHVYCIRNGLLDISLTSYLYSLLFGKKIKNKNKKHVWQKNKKEMFANSQHDFSFKSWFE